MALNSSKRLISLAARENAEAEIFSLRRDLRSIRIAGNEIVEAQNMIEEGYGIRVVKDGGNGFAATSGMNRGSLEKSFKAALSMARKSKKVGGWRGFPDRSDRIGKEFPEWVHDKELASMQPWEMAELALRMIREASSNGERKRSLAGVLIVLLEEFSILNSNGLEHLAEPSSIVSSRIAIETRKDDHFLSSTKQFCSRKFSDFKPEQEVREAISSTSKLDSLQKMPIKKGKYDVILSPESTGAFTSYLISPMVTGKAIQSGVSCLAGKLKTRIASESYSLVDDGRMEGGIGSSTADDEGTSTQRTSVVEKGVLRGFLYDLASAGVCGTSSTGNARRASDTLGRTYLAPPDPSSTNLITATGEHSYEELIEETKRGIIVNSIGYTFHLVPERGYFNIVSNVPLIIVENGQIRAYAENLVISGELEETLMKIDAVGNEAYNSVHMGSIATLSPYMKIKEMDVVPSID